MLERFVPDFVTEEVDRNILQQDVIIKRIFADDLQP
jgi:hypothetical protein